jgi:ABC-type glycerol-3-phosphate transport system permease component
MTPEEKTVQEQMLTLLQEKEARRGQWGPAMAALTGALVVIAVLVLIAARQV